MPANEIPLARFVKTAIVELWNRSPCSTNLDRILHFRGGRKLPLGALLAGDTVTTAAKRAKVSRATVHNWLNEQNFRDEFDKRHAQLIDRAQVRLQSLADRAVDVVATALKRGDAKTALQLLKGLELLSPNPTSLGRANAALETKTIPEPLTMEQGRRELQEILDRVLQREAEGLGNDMNQRG
jgi:hypothetical protein